ncbi:MAG: glycoside hydrolase [Candidatus Rokubacteria bacterium GWC2_70_16]|nr:MAG: glycoside hydrolase [Candidatus Rokubacteria bacterium GWC2_70_16]
MKRTAAPLAADGEALVEACRQKSVELLRTNLSPQGILAATPNARAEARGYAAIFGRDAAVCAIGMALSGDAVLAREAATGLVTLAGYQAANGQIPKFVDLRRQEADFWYLGCIDATLWWLIALDFLDRRDPALWLRQRLVPAVAKAIQWLEAQEHQRFFLLQQNEASDWADIMPRSGFVLYTNALWYCVKQLYGLARAEETHANFNQLFHPFSADLAEYRRARLLAHYVKRNARNRDLYLSFVNFSFFGEEGDVFGNLLALLCGLADREAARRTLRALDRAGIAEPWPVRVVCEPIPAGNSLWRAYMSRHRQNLEWQYHNGGIWPFVGGFWVAALAQAGERDRANAELAKLAHANALDGWSFNEWLHGRTLAPRGMRGQSWNAAAFLMALNAVRSGNGAFALRPR